MWTLYDVAKVCQESSKANFVQLVGTHDMKAKVTTHDWSNHLGQFFKRIPNIKEYQHFMFSKSTPGIVSLFKFLGDEPTTFNILKENVILTDLLPPTINPIGITLDRQQYLYKEIRQFCKLEISLLLLGIIIVNNVHKNFLTTAKKIIIKSQKLCPSNPMSGGAQQYRFPYLIIVTI